MGPACSSCPGDLECTVSLQLYVQQHLFQEIKDKEDKFPCKSKLHLCTGFGWDKVTFLDSSWRSVVFWIQYGSNAVNNTLIFGRCSVVLALNQGLFSVPFSASEKVHKEL